MTLQVGTKTIETSKEVEQLPRELIDFAIANRSTNGNYYWSQKWGNLGGPNYRLDRILIIDRIWSWTEKTRALSIIKFMECINDKVVKAVLSYYNWNLLFDNQYLVWNAYNGICILFIENGGFQHRFFNSIDDVHYALLNAKTFYAEHGREMNHFYGLTDEEILITYDLEQSI